VTLTYNDENLPENGSLVPEHLKNFQKRIRYHANIDLRFFSVGEYGEKTQRPHYHAAVFGLPGCSSLDHRCACSTCETVRRSWKKGHILAGTLTQDSASYIAGYVTKKMTDRKPEEKYKELLRKGKKKIAEEYKTRVIDVLQGRHPEFARMSLGTPKNPNPVFHGGIGAGILPDIQDMLETQYGCDLIHALNDTPDMIKLGGKEILLGSYLKGKLRQRIGIDEKTIQEKLSLLRQEKIQEYLQYRQETDSLTALSQKDFLLDKHKQKVRNLHKKISLKHNKGVL
jgi:hypothetical protein